MSGGGGDAGGTGSAPSGGGGGGAGGRGGGGGTLKRRVLAIQRRVSAVTGACLMTPRRAFESVGGFDTASGPARPENYIALPDPKVEALENRVTMLERGLRQAAA